MFLDGFFNEELFWLSFGDLITYTVISTVIIAEIGFVVWLLLKWLRTNVNINWSPVLHIGESDRRRSDSSVEKTEFVSKKGKTGAVDVKVDKSIFIGKIDEQSIKTDEVKKGKVKTQKDKLKKLRGK